MSWVGRSVIRGQNDLVGVGALDRSSKILILQCKFYATLFFKHFERLNFFSIQSKCLKNSKALNLCCKIIIGLVKQVVMGGDYHSRCYFWLVEIYIPPLL